MAFQVERFNFTTQSWEGEGSMKLPQAAHASAFVPGNANEPACILVLGGINHSQTPVQIFNLELKTWSLANCDVSISFLSM